MLRIIGDVHGNYREYLELIRDVDQSIQVGDFGFNYEYILPRVNSAKHKIIAGNHDNHDETKNWNHFLPKYGIETQYGLTYFHMQGAFSIDWRERIDYDLAYGTKSWWPNEQLNYNELVEAEKIYRDNKPDFVITHDAPRRVANIIGKPGALIQFGYDPKTFTTHTSEALQSMFEFHKPKRWIFGHYHVTKNFNLEGTEFQCLAELNYIDI